MVIAIQKKTANNRNHNAVAHSTNHESAAFAPAVVKTLICSTTVASGEGVDVTVDVIVAVAESVGNGVAVSMLPITPHKSTIGQLRNLSPARYTTHR